MNKNKLFLIIKREFLIRVKKKSFLLMTILTPLLFASLMVIPMLLSTMSSGDVRNIMVIDKSGITEEYFVSSEENIFTFNNGANLNEVKENFASTDLYAVVEISPLDANLNASVTVFSSKQLNLGLKSSIERSVKRALESNKLAKYEIADIDKILKDIETKVSVTSLVLAEDGTEKTGMVEIYMAASYASSILIYFFIFLFGSMVMRGVLEEKTNRVIEVIISSVKPFQLMLGKILGIGSVALVQFLIWVLLTGAITFGVLSAMAPEIGDQAAISSTMIDGGMATGLGMNGEELTASVEDSGMAKVMDALDALPIARILISFLLYFLLGYLLYASMFAAIGSAVDNDADTQQLVMPVTLPLIIGFFITMQTFQYPDSALSVWGSMIPFTSPMVMVARIPFGVPAWELALSIALLALTFLLMTYVSGKIYRVGILAYGKKSTWKDLMKWIKY